MPTAIGMMHASVSSVPQGGITHGKRKEFPRRVRKEQKALGERARRQRKRWQQRMGARSSRRRSQLEWLEHVSDATGSAGAGHRRRERRRRQEAVVEAIMIGVGLIAVSRTICSEERDEAAAADPT